VPVYAYACTVCGHSFDLRQSFTDEALTVCPECSGRLRKVIGSVGVTFKGSGFYRTDSGAGKSSKTSGGSSSGAGTSSGGSSSGGAPSGGASSTGSSESSGSTGTATTSSGAGAQAPAAS